MSAIGISKNICLYHLSLYNPSQINCSIYGNFSGPRKHEIILAKNHLLQLIHPDPTTGKINIVHSWECFGIIQSLMPFRLPGGKTDYVIIGSDSGRITILEYDDKNNVFIKIHEETYGKSGIRRIVPGLLLAQDPRGRAFMIAALEKQKFVYILNRDANNNLTISSPLEAHKKNTLLFSMVGLDVGFENPLFATIECDYDEINLNDSKLPPVYLLDQQSAISKYLTFYELDLGLNHVSRVYSLEIDNTSHLLIPLPGANDGPGGVLVSAQDRIYFINRYHPTLYVNIPRRYGSIDDNIMIETWTMHKQANMFFFLLQTEQGDIFRLDLIYNETNVNKLVLRYFDSIPVSTNLCLMRNGLLFSASQYSHHYLYQVMGVVEDDPILTDSTIEEIQYFNPHCNINLLCVDTMTSLSPMTKCIVDDLNNESNSQIYAASGSLANSHLSCLRYGLCVNELASTDLYGSALDVFSLKFSDSNYHTLLCIPFSNATLTLSIGDTISEVNDERIQATSCLSLYVMLDDNICQTFPNLLRICPSSTSSLSSPIEWKPLAFRIKFIDINERQILLSLENNLLYYLIFDGSSLFEKSSIDLHYDISCLALSPTVNDQMYGRYAAVGLYHEHNIIIYDLLSSTNLEKVSTIKSPSLPYNIKFHYLGDNFFCNIGTNDGILCQCHINVSDGSVQDINKRFLGYPSEVKLFVLKFSTTNSMALLAICQRNYLHYLYQNVEYMIPLSYPAFFAVNTFCSEQCEDGIVGVIGESLRIIHLPKLNEIFNITTLPLRYTPRSLISHHFPSSDETNTNPHTILISAESDHYCYSFQESQNLLNTFKLDEAKENKPESPQPEESISNESSLGWPRAPIGHCEDWFLISSRGSCLRIIDCSTLTTHNLYDMANNECILCLCIANFSGFDGEFLCVGSAQDFIPHPPSFTSSFISLYRLEQNASLTLVHKTLVEGIVYCLHGFQGKLLAGIGTVLRLFEMGKRKLLRKGEYRHFPTGVKNIFPQGNRIWISDMQEGFHLLYYKTRDHLFYLMAEERVPRFLTASCPVDYITMAGGDKFGNIFFTKIPDNISDTLEDDPRGGVRFASSSSRAPNFFDETLNFYIGEPIMSLQKIRFAPGNNEVIFYSTISGTLGVLIPFISRADVEFFTHLEMHLRQNNPSLLGRDHLQYRGYYFPVKDVIDGDLCEQFTQLNPLKQSEIAQEIYGDEGTSSEIIKNIERMRHALL